MRTEITGDNIDLTPALRDFTSKKMEKLKTFQDNITSAHVVLSVDKTRHIAEAQIHIPSHTIVAKAEAETMYIAIDGLIDKLTRQLKRHSGH